MRDSNSRPPACEADILPTELMARLYTIDYSSCIEKYQVARQKRLVNYRGTVNSAEK